MEQAGKLVRCPTCFSAITVPLPEPESTTGNAQQQIAEAADDRPVEFDLQPESHRSPGASSAAVAAQSRLLGVKPLSGRRFGFNCAYCSSRLEAVESQSGDEGACPTCGNNIIIPICDRYGRLLDPLTGKIIKQDPHPVHAYAAAGERAPKILRKPTGEQAIQCPRCGDISPISANNCKGCGIPFTMEGTAVDAPDNNSGMAVASVVLGVIGWITPCLVVPALLSVVFGAISLASAQKTQGQGKGMAITGLVFGALGLLFSFHFYSR